MVARTSSSFRLLLLIGLAFVLTLAGAGLLKAGLDQVLPSSPWLQEAIKYQADPEPSYDLARPSRRLLMAITLTLLICWRRWVPWSALARKGLAGHGQARRNLGYGLALALVLVLVYAGIILGSGLASWADRGIGLLVRKVLEYSLAAAAIALLEEVFFRGVMFRQMLKDWGACAALTASSAVYAVLHCVSGTLRVEPGWQPLVGADLLRAFLTDGSGSFLPDLRMIVGLFILGWLLAYLYLRTGSLWSGIGLHAGVVLFSKLMKKALDRADGFPEWLWGDPLFIISGVGCWLLLLILVPVVITTAPRRRHWKRSSPR
jgi:membrane protease YdiL (CAAX protease family)